jgi:hypothetical protein
MEAAEKDSWDLTKKWNTFGLGRENRMGQSHIINNADNGCPYIYATALNFGWLNLMPASVIVLHFEFRLSLITYFCVKFDKFI